MSYIIVAFIVGLLVFIHELGHYAAARLVGIPIARVSLGIGRPLVSVRRGATEYRLSAFPFGGYVMPRPEAYFAQPPLRRLVLALGGPVANLLLAFMLMATFNCSVYGVSVTSLLTLPLEQTGRAVALVIGALPHLLFGSPQVVGPLGVIAEGGGFIGSGVLLTLQFAAVMSVNLAILNLVPIPPLDGGRIVLSAAESVWSRAARLHVPLNLAGFLVLVTFLWWVTASDVGRILGRLFV